MTTITFSEEQPSSSWPGRIAHGIQWVLFVVVMVFVVNYAAGQISRLDWSSISWSPFWLLAAIGVYFLSWVPAAFVWGELITSTGPKLDRYTILRAHYCGHIGKYVPGKALVLVIRAFLLKQAGVKVAVAGVMATAETLMTMATGLLLTLI
ncbi:MAG: flippase-like domain-containing protein, partial [Planctomycetaceae bacterium]|nr:flippase-like domain-containing protein [Planctomycetaceae bacterium]